MMFYLHNGGVAMWMIGVASVIVTGIFLERLFHYRRAQINTDDFLQGIYNVLKKRNPVEAVSLCNETPGPVSKIVRAAVLHHDEEMPAVRNAVETAGTEEIPRLEQNLPLMAVLIRTLPLLGLLGTVLGFIDALMAYEQAAPLVHGASMASGMWKALLTSAAAMTVAIPAYIGYQFLLTRLQSILLNMEHAAADVISFMQTNRFKMTPLLDLEEEEDG
jgi:biopolymer transport protein ExbB